MKAALIIDDATRSDYILKEFFEEVEDLGDYLGMKAYLATYKGSKIKVCFFNSPKDAVALRTEDLFLFEDLEIIINVGYCFCSPEQNKVQDSEIVVVSAAKCDHSYRATLHLDDSYSKQKSHELDKKLEKKLTDASEKLGISVKTVSCCSVTSLQDLSSLQEAKMSCGCFDQKAFALYEMARKYNRNTVCLYRTRSHNLIDLHHYLLEKQEDSLDELIQIALEFETRCRVKQI